MFSYYLELDYAFGLFTGILLTSTFWFVLYCFCLKLKPKINPKLTIPALFSGVLFGIGNGRRERGGEIKIIFFIFSCLAPL